MMHLHVQAEAVLIITISRVITFIPVYMYVYDVMEHARCVSFEIWNNDITRWEVADLLRSL